MFPSYLEVGKTGSQLFRASQTLLQLFGERKNWISAIWNKKDQKMQFTTVRSKEKDYDIYLKSENWFTASRSTKKCFPAIWKCIKLDPSYFEPDKHCCRYLERGKSGSLLFGDQKMYFTTVRSKEKDYNIYLKSEKLVHEKMPVGIKLDPSYFEPENTVVFGERKKWILLFGDQKMYFTTVRRKKIITSI